mmetsp:Transcript_76167/g.191751  ORF Transcript_76167/g.191751 Transcript_76167/m.191751 type:complete len:126 (-) Transcript_76167:814-1191(-)
MRGGDIICDERERRIGEGPSPPGMGSTLGNAWLSCCGGVLGIAGLDELVGRDGDARANAACDPDSLFGGVTFPARLGLLRRRTKSSAAPPTNSAVPSKSKMCSGHISEAESGVANGEYLAKSELK